MSMSDSFCVSASLMIPLSWRVDQDVAHSPREAGAKGKGQVGVERVRQHSLIEVASKLRGHISR